MSITVAGLTRLTVLYTLIRLPPVVCGLNWITWLFYNYGILPWHRTFQIDQPQTSWHIASSFSLRWQFTILNISWPDTIYIPACPSTACIFKFSGFVFWNLQNRLVSKICKLADASASLLQSQFDTHHLFPLLTLTRSFKTSYLSQYLQTLTQTIDKLIIPYNNLKPCIIQRRSHGQPHPTWQILRHTRLATGTISWLKNRDNSRIAEPGNVTWF